MSVMGIAPPAPRRPAVYQRAPLPPSLQGSTLMPNVDIGPEGFPVAPSFAPEAPPPYPTQFPNTGAGPSATNPPWTQEMIDFQRGRYGVTYSNMLALAESGEIDFASPALWAMVRNNAAVEESQAVPPPSPPTPIDPNLRPSRTVVTNPDGSQTIYELPSAGSTAPRPMEQAQANLWQLGQEREMEPRMEVPDYGSIPVSSVQAAVALLGFERPGEKRAAEQKMAQENAVFANQLPMSPYQVEQMGVQKEQNRLQGQRQTGIIPATPDEIQAYYGMLENLARFYRRPRL